MKIKLVGLMEEGSEKSRHGMKDRNFEESLNELFDIAGCQCIDLSSCSFEKEMKILRR